MTRPTALALLTGAVAFVVMILISPPAPRGPGALAPSHAER